MLQDWLSKNLFADANDSVALSTVVRLFRATLSPGWRTEWPAERIEQELAARIVLKRCNRHDVKFVNGYSLVDRAAMARQAQEEAERREAERQEAERIKAEGMEAKRQEAERIKAAEKLIETEWQSYRAERQTAVEAYHALPQSYWDRIRFYFFRFQPGARLSLVEIADEFNALDGRAPLTIPITRTILHATSLWPYLTRDTLLDHEWHPQCVTADGRLKWHWADDNGNPLPYSQRMGKDANGNDIQIGQDRSGPKPPTLPPYYLPATPEAVDQLRRIRADAAGRAAQ